MHTISVGIAKETDFDYHLEAISLLDQANDFVPGIEAKLIQESINVLGLEWFETWHENLPNWENTPGQINIPVLLWISNLLEAWDLEHFARARYQILGNASHWFPGNNANLLDINISENDLYDSLSNHANPKKVIDKLRYLKSRFADGEQSRLSKI